jgi:GlpG protein
MRLIGHLKNESSAKTLADYLVSVDIRSLIEPDAEGWAVWIYSEDQIEAGRQAFSNYLQNPGDSAFKQARHNAAIVDERKRREKAKFDERIHTPDRIWVSSGIGPTTLTLILVSVAVTLMGNVPSTSFILNSLAISERIGGPLLPEVRHGEIWRLFTPVFIHLNVWHIVFNMLILRDLGSLVESRQGSKVLLLLALVIGVGSNLGQYLFFGPGFGGMSGVLYGLLGYIWLRGHCDPASGLTVSPMTLGVMLVWFFLCLVGVIPNVANVCHAAGLLIGMIIGAAPLAKRAF